MAPPGRLAPAGPLGDKRIVICAGPGGVGKTTTAAALGALFARAGQRTLVCTIDPAPRLADALGVGALGAEPTRLTDQAAHALGITPPGVLFAAKLDTARAFRRLVEDKVADADMRGRILGNPIYREITTSLTGSAEYAATLALYEYVREGAFDVVVLDTPPTAHALDFLDAPRRIADAVKSPVIGWFARPPEGTRRLSWTRLRAGGTLVLRRLGKLVGSQFLDDLAAFLGDFRDVLTGFLERANAIEALLRRPDVAFLLVLTPDAPAVNEALFFSQRLADAGITLQAFVVNRIGPAAGIADAATLRARLTALPGLRDLPAAVSDQGLTDLADAATYLRLVIDAQDEQIARLARSAPGARVLRVPLFKADPSTLVSVRAVSDHLGAAEARQL